MIDLTPLDVRKKSGDFRKSLRGYDAAEVDSFLQLVAERMEELVKANLTLEERVQRLGEQVVSLGGRERAVNEALVTAQQLSDQIKEQAQREAEQLRREAEREAGQLRREAEHDAEHMAREARLEAKALLADAERQLRERRQALAEVENHRLRFLEAYRQLLQRQMELVQVEENRSPLDDVAVELDLGGGRQAAFGPDDASGAEPVDRGDDDGLATSGTEPEGNGAAGVEAVDDGTDAYRVESASDDDPAASVLVWGEVAGAVEEGADEDGAIPVEGLAPSDDDFDGETTILPESDSRAPA